MVETWGKGRQTFKPSYAVTNNERDVEKGRLVFEPGYCVTDND